LHDDTFMAVYSTVRIELPDSPLTQFTAEQAAATLDFDLARLSRGKRRVSTSTGWRLPAKQATGWQRISGAVASMSQEFADEAAVEKIPVRYLHRDDFLKSNPNSHILDAQIACCPAGWNVDHFREFIDKVKARFESAYIRRRELRAAAKGSSQAGSSSNLSTQSLVRNSGFTKDHTDGIDMEWCDAVSNWGNSGSPGDAFSQRGSPLTS